MESASRDGKSSPMKQLPENWLMPLAPSCTSATVGASVCDLKEARWIMNTAVECPTGNKND